ncbi:MAG: photosystem II complex extrinsic protein PsbU [Pseudanabaenaceae cyanobacterium]
MKTLLRVLCLLCLALSLLVKPVWADADPAALEKLPDTNFVKQDLSKIDLNNANITMFRRVRGMYPTLGRIIIDHAPYASLEDVLKIPDLTEAQKQLLRDNADKFTFYKPDNSMNRERINNSTYRL